MKTILVPTDFSKNAGKAVEYAIRLAEQGNRKIIFLHSTFQFIPTSNSYTTYLKKVDKEKMEKMKMLQKHIDKIYASIRIKRNEDTTKLVVKFGHSLIDHIVEMANGQFIDLVVMGTHGASNLKKMLTGSNTSNVMEKIYCPVLAIPANYKFNGIRKIAYATADLAELKTELKKVIPFSQIFDARLEIFHLASNKDRNKWMEDFDGNAFLSDLKTSLKYRNMGLQLVDIKNESINYGIEKFVAHHKPDVLAMLTHKRGFFTKLFNSSKTINMSFHLKTPLLAIK